MKMDGDRRLWMGWWVVGWMEGWFGWIDGWVDGMGGWDGHIRISRWDG
jgi:hypothetical protein